MIEQRDLKIKIVSNNYAKIKEDKEFIEYQYNNLSESNKHLTKKILDLLNIQNNDKQTINEKLIKNKTMEPDSTTI